MPITLSKIQYGTRSILLFEALEQTLRLRLVSGPVNKQFFFLMGNRLSRTVDVTVSDSDPDLRNLFLKWRVLAYEYAGWRQYSSINVKFKINTYLIQYCTFEREKSIYGAFIFISFVSIKRINWIWKKLSTVLAGLQKKGTSKFF